MEFATRTDLIEAVMSSILKIAAEGFPTTRYATPQAVAAIVGIEFETVEKEHYPDTYVFPDFFDEKFNTIVRSSVHWLVANDFLLVEEGDAYEKAILSERGARLMGCWPKCLGK